MKNAIVFLLLTSLSLPTFPLYKCEENGNVLYSDKACANARKIDAGDGQLSSISTRNSPAYPDQGLVNRNASQRKREEVGAEKEAARRKRALEAKQKKCLLLDQRRKWAQDDVRAAQRKSVEKKKRTFRHAEERYILECGGGVNPALLR